MAGLTASNVMVAAPVISSITLTILVFKVVRNEKQLTSVIALPLSSSSEGAHK